MSEITPYVIEPEETEQFIVFFFPAGFVACAISNYTAKYPINLSTWNIGS